MKKIVIIGAGIGGLTAGNLLAKKGHQVTLFEAHSTPGGYIAGFSRRGYYFESGTLSFESSSQVFHVMKKIGVYDKINFVKKEPFRFVSDEFDSTINSWDDMKQLLYSSYSDQKENINSFFAVLDPIIKELKTISSIPSPTYAKGIKKLYLGLLFLLKGGRFMKLFKKYGPVTVLEFVSQFFKKDTRIFNFLSTLGYPEMSSIGLAGMMEMFTDFWTVKDGLQSWTDVLADNFKQLGGDLKLNAYVDKIITKNGTAVGVKVGDQTYRADYVLSAGDYKKTFLKLLDNKSLIPNEMLNRIKEAPVSKPFFTAYLGLNLPNDLLRKNMQVAAIMLFNTLRQGDAENPFDQDFFDKYPLVIYSPSMINQQLAPDGKSSLMIQAISPHGWMDNWGGGNKEKYTSLKKRVMETFIKRTEAVIPNLSNYIDYADAATPLTYERYTHNTDGAHTSWSIDPRKSYYSSGTTMKIDTPVKHLYISSGWATPYGGVPEAMGVGYTCAQLIR